jgi:O-antigen ligase
LSSPVAVSWQSRRSLMLAGGGGALAIAVVATYKPIYAPLAVVGCFLVVLTMTNLVFGVAALTLLSFFERLPGLSGLTLTKPFGLVLVVSWLATLARARGRAPMLLRDRPGLGYLAIAFVAWGAVSAGWAVDGTVALSNAVRLALVAILFFVVYTAIESVRDLLVVAWAFLTGAFLVAFTALTSGQTVAGRLSGGVLDPNYLAAVLASSVVIAGFLLVVSRRPARILLAMFMVTDVVALVRTESRGGLIATAAALVAACAVAGPIRTQVIAVVAITFAVGIGYYALAAPASLRQRITNVSAQGSAGRSDIWRIASHVAAKHPIAGVGLGNFRIVETSYLPANADLINVHEVIDLHPVVHNTYLELLTELGGVGLALFLGLVFTTVAAAARAISLLRGPTVRWSLLTRGLLAGSIGLLVAYFFLSGEYEKELWLLLGLLSTTPNVARSLLADAARG